MSELELHLGVHVQLCVGSYPLGYQTASPTRHLAHPPAQRRTARRDYTPLYIKVVVMWISPYPTRWCHPY